MIVLYIFLGLISFILLFTTFVILVPFKFYLDAAYWNNDPKAKVEVYWIKYIFGARVSLKDLEKLRILIWFFGIPIPFSLSLNPKEKKTKREGKDKEQKDENKDEVRSSEKQEPKKKSIKQQFANILGAKDMVIDFWDKYKAYFKKIFVRYITFSLEFLELELGFDDPAQTGKIAGIVYSTLPFVPMKNINVAWNYQKQKINISSGLKITMKFYGILCTLLKLYSSYKKDKKNEV